jgi:hypothetical protein
MSREQRRQDKRNQGSAASGGGGVDRRTPVKAPGAGFPWAPVIVAGSTLAVVLLIAYLIFQVTSDDGESLSAADRAEQDASTDLPGEFFVTQGRRHFDSARDGFNSFSPNRTPWPFCPGVTISDQAGEPAPELTGTADATGTPAATNTPAPTNTPAASATPSDDTPAPGHTTSPVAAPTGVRTDCYLSNPPSSGPHLNVAVNVDLGDGIILPRIPPDPRVYDRDVIVPRESIAHILEHAGVFVGWNCEEGDEDCERAVADLEDLVNDRLDRGERVVMSRSTDLPPGTLASSSWTRVLWQDVAEYEPDMFRDFIGTHSCRFDPEGFC